MNKKQIPIFFLIVVVVACLFFLSYKTSSYATEIDILRGEKKILEAQRDSLQDEIFFLDIEMSRYERSTDHLRKIDPEAAEEWLRFYTQETE